VRILGYLYRVLWCSRYIITDCYPCMRLSEKDVLELDKKVKAEVSEEYR